MGYIAYSAPMAMRNTRRIITDHVALASTKDVVSVAER